MLSFRAIFLLMMFACATNPPNDEPAATPWRIAVETSGGITGMGQGNYTITSGGAITVRTMNGRDCSFTATAEELQRIGDAVAKARPTAWKESYVPRDSCCDRIETVFTLRTTTTRWITEPEPMPADLVALAETVDSVVRGRYMERCR